HDHRQVRRESRGFLFPVCHDRRGAYEEVRVPLSLLAPCLDECQRLHGLSQAHVVRETCAQAPIPQERKPRVSPCLVRTEGALESGRRGQLLELPVPPQAFQQAADPPGCLDAPELHSCHLARGAQGEREKIPCLHAGRGFSLPERKRGRDLFRAHCHPLPAHLYKRRLQRGQRFQLLPREHLVPERNLPAHVQHFLQCHACLALQCFRAAHPGAH